ncbi:MAG: hypothetical protein ACR2NU_05660, partial [Aeoliella sp.]
MDDQEVKSERHQPSRSDTSASEWLEARPRLRPDLVFRPQKVADRFVYIVEDPVRTRFYRLGREEYLLAASFDGQTTVREILARVNQGLADDELTERDALAILNWA